MNTRQRMVVALAAGWMALSAGCVGLDEHRQLQMDNRKLTAEKAQLEQELYDTRNNNDSLRAKLSAYEGTLQSKEMLAANLEAENARLEKSVTAAQSLAEEIARKNVPNDPILIETRLPAELDTALRDFAARFPDSVYYDPQRGIVKWTSDLLFALGSDIVKDSAVSSLNGFAEILNSPAASGFEALIVGHTDSMRISREETRRLHPTNWHLSVHRAIAVSDVLQQHGVAADRIGVMGFGEYRPIAPNDSEAGRSQNRRVEIYIVPSGTIGGVVVPRTSQPTTEIIRSGAPEADGIK